MSVQSIQINDGQWHSVSLEVDGNYAKLILDRVHTASGIAPGTLRTLNLDNYVFFGGHIRQQGTRHGRSPQVSNGFRGCMDSIILNGQELPLNSKPRSYAHMEESVDVLPGCLLSTTEDCSSNPCQNGGICKLLPNGGELFGCDKMTLMPSVLPGARNFGQVEISRFLIITRRIFLFSHPILQWLIAHGDFGSHQQKKGLNKEKM